MPHVLLTTTTYGTWLPGDARGSVTRVRDCRPGDPSGPHRVVHNRFGEAWEAPIPGLRASAAQALKEQPVWPTPEQAWTVVDRLVAKGTERGWRIEAVSVMRNHFHAVVAFDGDIETKRMLANLKAYASAGLNAVADKPRTKWWTRGGSTRSLPDERAVAQAIRYVLHKQQSPLARWSREHGSF